ncbi:prephenate dehydrogenase [Skermania sp. ID1734]|uniref:prephenate dehydrogenase n=1 Tax=Skermania sp. ID1734 TaxID=2597516 RepID=UPI00117F300E|nr:prephenate dehydrogenase [Skermania sp. ID1734]TSE00676.1 prephenate dehydrogenase [Skermania sp. ID1734]
MSAGVDPPVCVLGLGLIGGSVLRAAVAAGRTAFGYNRSDGAVRAARGDGFDASTDLAAVLDRAAAASALIVIAVPMPAVDAVLAAIAEHAPDCPLTDVVSVKGAITAAVQAHDLSRRFVGGHPMAGTAESGWEASFAELFADAAWVVETHPGVDPEVWTQVARLAVLCGAVVVPAQAREHDLAVARVSHLPHVLAEALASAGANGGDLALGLAAGSFRDGTRVAGSAPELVRAMCEANSTALVHALDETLDALTQARSALADRSSVADLVTAGHQARQRYERFERWDISGITPGSPDWVNRMLAAGRSGGVLRKI